MTAPRVRLRPEIESMVPYRQGRPAAPDAFKLSSNENPFTPPQAVLDAIADTSVNRYPDASSTALRAVLSQRWGVDPGRIQVGAGSVSVLAQLISAAAAHGDEVIYSWRSFEAYPILVTAAGATNVPVPNSEDHRHDLDAMADAITDRTRLVIVCSPNNPTSTIVTGAEFEAFMTRVPAEVLVVLDEAYAEFVTDPAAVAGGPLIHRYPNLVVLRTFSKAFGLAGLRIGYAVGPEYVMDAARAVAIPLSVTEAAQRGALASLDHEAELLDRVTELSALRDSVWRALTDQGWRIPQPHGNFVWLPSVGDSVEAAEIFARHGLITRPFPQGLRVSIGESAAVETLLAAAGEVVGLRRQGHPTATLD